MPRGWERRSNRSGRNGKSRREKRHHHYTDLDLRRSAWLQANPQPNGRRRGNRSRDRHQRGPDAEPQMRFFEVGKLSGEVIYLLGVYYNELEQTTFEIPVFYISRLQLVER